MAAVGISSVVHRIGVNIRRPFLNEIQASPTVECSISRNGVNAVRKGAIHYVGTHIHAESNEGAVSGVGCDNSGGSDDQAGEKTALFWLDVHIAVVGWRG